MTNDKLKIISLRLELQQSHDATDKLQNELKKLKCSLIVAYNRAELMYERDSANALNEMLDHVRLIEKDAEKLLNMAMGKLSP